MLILSPFQKVLLEFLGFKFEILNLAVRGFCLSKLETSMGFLDNFLKILGVVLKLSINYFLFLPYLKTVKENRKNTLNKFILMYTYDQNQGHIM